MTGSRCLGGNPRRAPRREQSGVVLFITLVVMVALSLAGIALIRATETGTVVTGNLAFKQASIAAIDRGIESAIHALWYDSMDRTVDHADRNYYACVRNAGGTGCIAPGASANSVIPDRPDAIASVAKMNAAGLSTTLVPTDAAGNKAYYVVERMCLAAGPATALDCNVSAPPSGADPGMPRSVGSGEAFYRVTVRVEGPRNTVTYAQAILSDKRRVSWRILNN